MLRKLAAVTVILLSLCIPGMLFGQDLIKKEPQSPESMGAGPTIRLIHIPEDYFFTLRVDPSRLLSLGAATATFNVNFINSGTDFWGNVCTPWPDEAKNAFKYATDVWATYINSSVPIAIDACWASGLGQNVLGQASAANFYRNFTGAPTTNTWYPIVLTNAISGSDLDPNNPDMYITYSKDFNWYFGTDGYPGSGKTDFASVIMHEIAHGLGFSGSMTVSNSQGSWGLGTGNPIAYDRFTENGSGQSLINTSIFANPSAALASQLTSNNIYFNGKNANAANGGTRPKLYTPSQWAQGSSYVHLDYDTYKGTVNALMKYAISNGEAIHIPGPVTMGILQDLGWSGGGTCSLTKPTLISPSGSVSTTPTYTWNSVAGAEQYELYVTDPGKAGRIDAWYTAAQVNCASGGTCSITPTTALAAGAATFKVRGWASCNGGTYGSWSDEMNFTVATSTCSTPAKPTLVSPTGTIATTTPTYTWNAVSGAEWYWLWVSDSTASAKISTWYTAAQVGCTSGTGTCSITPTTALAAGRASFWVQAYKSCGGGTYGPWSDPLSFTVSGSTCSTPAKPTLVSPTGTITTTTPAYTWNAVSGAEQYELYVTDSGKAGKIDTWYTAAQVNCASGGTCSITPATALATGAATFWVRGWASCNGGTYGPWSDAMNFTVSTSTCSTPAKPTLVSPTGTITTTTPTYTWNAVSGAEWYNLYVSDSSANGKISTWYTAAQVGCTSGTGTCSIAPTTALAAGSATFWVQAYKSCGGGTYGPWSDPLQFTVSGTGGGFDEQFNGSSATNWIQDSGTWTVGGGYYYTPGIVEAFSNSTYNANFSNFDFQSRFYRNPGGCSYCGANYLMVRASGSISDGTPANSYRFQYLTNGQFSVWKRVNGTYTSLQDWSSASAINTGGTWNTLRVVANGSSFWFYINGTLVWSGSDSSLTSGRAGVGMYGVTASSNDFYVDYATLTTSSSDITDAVTPEQQRFNHIANAVGGGNPDKSR